MHELAVMRSILKLCTQRMEQAGKTRIKTIALQVGQLRNIEEEWMQKYFDFISPGTPAEGATVKIEKIPLVFRCEKCSKEYQPDPHRSETFPCPICKSEDYDMVSGRELLVEYMEIE